MFSGQWAFAAFWFYKHIPYTWARFLISGSFHPLLWSIEYVSIPKPLRELPSKHPFLPFESCIHPKISRSPIIGIYSHHAITRVFRWVRLWILTQEWLVRCALGFEPCDHFTITPHRQSHLARGLLGFLNQALLSGRAFQGNRHIRARSWWFQRLILPYSAICAWRPSMHYRAY